MIKQQLKEMTEYAIAFHGLSQYQLSKKLGLARQTVNLWFNNGSNILKEDISADKCILILECLGYKLSVNCDVSTQEVKSL